MVAQNKWLLEPEGVLEALIHDTSKHIAEQRRKQKTASCSLRTGQLRATQSVTRVPFTTQTSALLLTELCLHSILV